MTTINLADYYQPHEGQKIVHNNTAQHKTLYVGRRWGKSRCAFGEFLIEYEAALGTPAPPSMVPPFHAWIVVPTNPQGRQTWNELMALIPAAMIHRIREDLSTIELVGNENRPWGLLEMKSAHDPDNLQTVGLDFLWVQEAQDISNKAFEKLLPTLRSPGRRSRAVFEGIPPMFHTHWFQRIYDLGKSGEHPDYFSFHATAFENPTLSDFELAAIEKDRALLTERAWRRMYLAEFSEDAGYFTNVSACSWGDNLGYPMPGTTYVAGLDLGRKMDPSVLVIGDALTRRLVAHYQWDTEDSWLNQRTVTKELCKEWGVKSLVVDATGMGGDIFTEQLADEGLPVEPYIITPASRDTLLSGLAVAIERSVTSFPPSMSALMRQLQQFQYRKMPSGMFKAEAPPGEHDEYVFAHSLFLTACADPPPVGPPSGLISASSRYVPTQEEANAGSFHGRTKAATMMRNRRSERMLRRLEELGIDLEM